eukprot:scaffold111_cov252-Pinguiococcus_pyrenoidosus.AAC.4
MSRFDPSKTSSVISELQSKGDALTKEIVLQRKRLADLDEALRQTEREIRRYRLRTKSNAVDVLNLHTFTAQPAHQRADGVNPTHIADENQRNIIARMEVRLNKLQVRRSEMDNENSKLQEAINKLRKKRLNSDAIRTQLEHRIRCEQAEIARLMELSAQLNEEREAAMDKMREVRRKGEEEDANCSSECSSIDLYVYEQNLLLEESVAKAAKDVKDGTIFKESDDDPGVREEAELEARSASLAQKERQERSYLQLVNAKIKTYEDSFRRLKDVSGIDDIERLVDVFIKNDTEAFSLFNYVQTVNQDIEKEVRHGARIAQDIRKYLDDQNEEERQRATVVKQLQDEQEQAVRTVDGFDKLRGEAQRMLARISKLVTNLFFKIQADQMQGRDAPAAGDRAAKGSAPGKGLERAESKVTLLTGQGITDTNILQYMAMIEQRTVEIIAEYTRKVVQKESRAVSPVAGPPTPAEFGPNRTRGPVEFFEDD